MNSRTNHSTVDYSKWDNVADSSSDDDDGGVTPGQVESHIQSNEIPKSNMEDFTRTSRVDKVQVPDGDSCQFELFSPSISEGAMPTRLHYTLYMPKDGLNLWNLLVHFSR